MYILFFYPYKTYNSIKRIVFIKKISILFARKEKKPYLCTRQIKRHGSVAQLNRASDYGSEGYRFESCRSHELNLTMIGEWLRSSTE